MITLINAYENEKTARFFVFRLVVLTHIGTGRHLHLNESSVPWSGFSSVGRKKYSAVVEERGVDCFNPISRGRGSKRKPKSSLMILL